MTAVIQTLNVGSSTLKYGVYALDDLQCLCNGVIELSAQEGDSLPAALQAAMAETRNIGGDVQVKAIGHRVVHGGDQLQKPMLVNADTLVQLHALEPLAPLHMPVECRAIEQCINAWPSIPQVACFDTAFHATRLPVASLMGIPRHFLNEGIKRYGFHGLSYQYISVAMESIIPVEQRQRVVVAHLGSGSSACAMKDGKSMDTTMGFTALDGLVMGTRSGELDPGVLLYLQQQKGLDAATLHQLLYKESGLLGLSGISADMRELEASQTVEAQQARDLYCYRAAQKIAGLLPAIGGLDALIFTAGIGENSAATRAAICQYLAWLGLSIDADNNQRHATCVSDTVSQIGVYVIPTNEELMIATQTRELLSGLN